MNTPKPSITIIGTGALGSTLEQFLRESEYNVRSTWNSRGGAVLSDETGTYQEVSSALPKNTDEVGDLIFITTPDDRISEIAHSLSERSIPWKERTVIHCSGNLTSDELAALSEKGAKTVSMHPIQTFKKGDGKEQFENIYISLQGDPETEEILTPMIKEMGATAILLDKKQKRFLHIAAVMASNYLVALMFATENLLKDAQLTEGFDSLKILINQTLKNIFDNDPEQALTGPVSRGDVDSVETHLQELRGREQEKLYKILGLEALKIAEKGGNLTQDQLNRMNRLFGD